mgnify:FL=1
MVDAAGEGVGRGGGSSRDAGESSGINGWLKDPRVGELRRVTAGGDAGLGPGVEWSLASTVSDGVAIRYVSSTQNRAPCPFREQIPWISQVSASTGVRAGGTSSLVCRPRAKRFGGRSPGRVPSLRSKSLSANHIVNMLLLLTFAAGSSDARLRKGPEQARA